MATGGKSPDSVEDYPFDFSWISHLLDEDDENGPTSAQVQIPDCNSGSDTLESSFSSWYPKMPNVVHIEGNNSSVPATYIYEVNSSTDATMDTDRRWDRFPGLAALWETPKVSTYAKLHTQPLGHIFFYVDGGSKSWEPGVHLKTTVVDPNNCPVSVYLRKELLPFSTRHIGSFTAIIPGCYTVAVTDGLLNVPVTGSPFTITVSRNYYMFIFWGPPRVFVTEVVKPWGVAYSHRSKKIYLTDRDSHQISIYSDKFILERKFGFRGGLLQAFYRPTGIAVDDRNERLVITDKDNHRVCVYTLQGKFLFAFGNKGFKNGEFNHPWGISVSPKDSTIAIADSRNHRLQFFDANGNYLRKYSVYETRPFDCKTEFNSPRGLAFDLTGENIFVTDFNIQSIFKLNSALTEKTDITPKGVCFSRPQGITVDPAGNIICAESRSNYVRVINPQGRLVASIPGHTVSSFSNPQDVAILPNGEIVVIGANSKITIL